MLPSAILVIHRSANIFYRTFFVCTWDATNSFLRTVMSPSVDSKTLEILLKRINKKTIQKEHCRFSLAHQNRKIGYKGRTLDIARLLWQRHNQMDIPLYYTFQPTCGNHMCIQPSHLKFGRNGNPTEKEDIKALMHLRSTPDGECRILQCGTDRKGYGLWSIAGKRYALQRVVIWLHGKWNNVLDMPSDLHAAHLCRNLTCINPKHYELVTRKVNMGHKVRDGTLIRGQNCHLAKMTENTAKAIIDSWRPKKHPEHLKIKDRAKKFGVSSTIVTQIDGRRRWNHLPHPNQRPLPNKKKVKTATEVHLSPEDCIEIIKRLKDRSSVNSTLNEFTQTPCWVWKTVTKDRPAMNYKGIGRYASIFACHVSSGPKPFKDAQARHRCGVSRCIRPDHLTWGSVIDNMADKRIHGTSSNKLTISKAREIRNSTARAKDLAENYNVSRKTISDIRLNLTWRE